MCPEVSEQLRMEDLRFLFDCRYVRWDQHDGISRYTCGIIRSLAGRLPVQMIISDVRQLDQLPDLPWVKLPRPTDIREALMPLYLNRLKPDIVFSPMQTMGSLGRKYRLLLTVHDLTYFTYKEPPRQFSWRIRLLWRLFHISMWPQRMLLNRADAVCVVSQTTTDLVARHRLTKRSMILVPNASSLATSGARSLGFKARTPSIVYMGAFQPHKNVETLILAMQNLPGWTLHLMSPITEMTRQRLQSLAPAASLIFYDGATDEEYVTVLQHATALVSASRSEGFGIPLVESMAFGTPVVISDLPIFREIAGAAGIYCDPSDPGTFVDGIRSLQNPEKWAHYSERSVIEAMRWNWESSVDALLKGIEDLYYPLA